MTRTSHDTGEVTDSEIEAIANKAVALSNPNLPGQSLPDQTPLSNLQAAVNIITEHSKGRPADEVRALIYGVAAQLLESELHGWEQMQSEWSNGEQAEFLKLLETAPQDILTFLTSAIESISTDAPTSTGKFRWRPEAHPQERDDEARQYELRIAALRLSAQASRWKHDLHKPRRQEAFVSWLKNQLPKAYTSLKAKATPEQTDDDADVTAQPTN